MKLILVIVLFIFFGQVVLIGNMVALDSVERVVEVSR